MLFKLTFLLVSLVCKLNADSRRTIYFAIAAPPSVQSYSRAFNKSLVNITQSYLVHGNITLDTLPVELPENGSFSATLLKTVCDQFEGKHVAAVLVVGDTAASFTVSMAAKHSGIPVLWARGNRGFFPRFGSLMVSKAYVLYIIVKNVYLSMYRSAKDVPCLYTHGLTQKSQN